MKKITLFALCMLAASTVSFAQDDNEDKKFTLEVSGEVDASFRNYNGDRFENEHEGSKKAYMPCFAVYGEYNFAPRWTAAADIEFVSGCGMQVDEISIARELCNGISFKGGILELPIGHHNAGWGYTEYFTNADPEGESNIISTPLSEMGVALFGELDCGIDYQLSVTSGMNPAYMSAQYWAYDCTQGFFGEDNTFTSPAYSLKLGYTGIEGLTLNAGVYYCADAVKNMEYSSLFKEQVNVKTPMTIWFADAEYAHDYFTLRGSIMQGKMKNADRLTTFFADNDVEWADDGEIAKTAMTYMAEAGVNLKSIFYPETKGPDLVPFVHYECYDTQNKVTDKDAKLDGSKVKEWAFGVNYKPNENVTLKCNYTTRNLGADLRNMNEINLAVAYDLSIF